MHCSLLTSPILFSTFKLLTLTVLLLIITTKEGIMSTIHSEQAITTPYIASREEWLKARLELLDHEKELTRLNDEVARKRQQLPWVKIDKDYAFDTIGGKVSLAELFKGRSQLLVYHFMFGPDYQAGCPSCSAIADGFNGITTHLANHDVMLWAVSRAPLQKLQAYAQRMGWSFPWASSYNGDFNFDFNVSFTEAQQREGIEYNYHREPEQQTVANSATIASQNTPDGASIGAAMSGTDVSAYTRERPGVSAFIIQDGVVYHTYSAYSRGVDALWNAYQWFDRASRGRNETGYWWQRHDEYDQQPKGTTASKHCCD
jgi:predicted dithiol-disulfide oxidoreductase (DUF899 family)